VAKPKAGVPIGVAPPISMKRGVVATLDGTSAVTGASPHLDFLFGFSGSVFVITGKGVLNVMDCESLSALCLSLSEAGVSSQRLLLTKGWAEFFPSDPRSPSSLSLESRDGVSSQRDFLLDNKGCAVIVVPL
jgi:hypothetical protein